MDAPTKNLQTTSDKHAVGPTKTHATSYPIHVLPLSNRCGWKQPIFR